jgi:ubiquinone/menaquinone biosynthesis C-methylase UbiE
VFVGRHGDTVQCRPEDRKDMADYPKELVLRVNEVFHDVEGRDYEGRHPEIFRDESARWQRTARQYIIDPALPLCVLDVGSGTGFVPLHVGPLLKAGDVLICSDLSSEMLRVCRQNLEAARLPCRLEFLKLDGRRIGLESGSCDVVTMNSVLHHVPDLAEFLRELDRLIRPGGRLVVAHEPNKAYHASRLLRYGSALAGALFTPKQAAGSVLRRLGLIGAVKRLLRPVSGSVWGQARLLDAVNRRLLDEHVIDAPLTGDQLTAIVDIQSPTAGGFHPGRGIDPEALARDRLPGFAVEHLETYDHLGDRASTRTRLTRWCDTRLRRARPKSGAHFLAVYRKPAGGVLSPTSPERPG